MYVPESCIPWIEKQRTKTGYFQDKIRHDYDLIKDYLPDYCKSVLDIGCGIGGINVYLNRHYKYDPMFYLYDFKKQYYTEKIKYGFNDSYTGYNSYDETINFIKANGIRNYKFINALNGFPTKLENIDIIISLLSWGYHYPVETYIEKAVTCMSEHGVMILDVRQGTQGIEALAEYFKSVIIIASENKSDKVVCGRIRE